MPKIKHNRQLSRSESDGYKPVNAPSYVYICLEVLCFMIAILSLSVNILIKSCGVDCYKYSITLFVVMLLAILLLELNRRDSFAQFTSYLFGSYNGKLRHYILVLFITLSILDIVLLAISEKCPKRDRKIDECDKPILNPDDNNSAVRWTTRSLTTISGLLMFGVIMAYWQLFSYYCAQNSYIHSFLYMTIFGYFFLSICRYLRPPPPKQLVKSDPFVWSWHIYHPIDKIISNIMIILFVIVLIFVGMGTFLLVAFAEAATSSSGLHAWGAVALYSVLALLMGITPLAPSTPVDACGGFLLLQIFVESKGWSIYLSWLVALLIVFVLHFIGSCLQYWIGKASCVQHWANAFLPPDLLAASDSVLRDANFFKVGMVGQVFMDTANGLNQGRMNMNFCTQFWSEYASIPSAIGWVTTGAVLAIPGLTSNNEDKYDWASQAVPICIMVATLWQMIASTLGANALASSTKTNSYWTSREKWITVQYYYKNGIQVTKEGWEVDIFKLRTLFDKIYPVHKKYVDISNTAKTGVDERIYAKQYEMQLKVIRKDHYDELDINRFNLNDKYQDLLLQGEIHVDDTKSCWKQNISTPKRIIQVTLVITAIICGGITYLRLSSPVSTEDAVQDGVKVFDFSDYYGWGCFLLFCLIYLVYYWNETISSFKSCGKTSYNAITCAFCKLDSRWETVFDIKHLQWVPKDYENEIEGGETKHLVGSNIPSFKDNNNIRFNNHLPINQTSDTYEAKNDIDEIIVDIELGKNSSNGYKSDTNLNVDTAELYKNPQQSLSGKLNPDLYGDTINNNELINENNNSNNSNSNNSEEIVPDIDSINQMRQKSKRELGTPNVDVYRVKVKKHDHKHNNKNGYRSSTKL